MLSSKNEEEQLMNFIYIHTHDSGRYMQPYGIGASNPNFMRLARESFMFHQAHCTAPTCSCSRTGMLSGMAPHSSGMFGLAHRGFHMQDFQWNGQGEMSVWMHNSAFGNCSIRFNIVPRLWRKVILFFIF